MPTSMEFWDLAAIRLKDAEELLGIKRWACAYYIAGYAVECALKAIVVREAERSGSVFDDKQLAKQLLESFYVHELEKLLKTANLEADFGSARGTNPVLNSYWKVVKDWKETSRYQQKIGQPEAEAFVQAINHDPDGVMKWIQSRW